jgi:L-iditol 2-dehydrogenase
MKCTACQIGEYGQCRNYNYFGSRCDGGFAEYIAVPLWNLLLIPDKVSFEEAAMTEPAAVAIHALRIGQVEIGDYVLILGAGPIGLMLAKWAQIGGAGKVLLIDIDDEKIEFAESQGFDYVCNSKKTDADAWIQEMTGSRGVDLAIEGTGVAAGLEQCLTGTRSFGRIVAMGNPAGEMKLSQKSYWELLRKQLTIKGTWNSSFVSFPKNDWNLALQMMEKKALEVTPFITHRLKLDEIPDALRMMRDRTAFYNKVMYINGGDM